MKPAKSKAVEFNPNSFDAQFATLHAELRAQNQDRKERMDAQDQVLKEIKIQTTLTNGRVTVLERKWEIKWRFAAGWIAGASAVAAIVWQVVFHFFR